MQSVSILGKKVKIKKVDLLSQGFVGLYSSHEKTIYIEKTLTGKEFVSTLMHEFGHAICDIYGFRQASFSLDLEELIVENFANVFCDIMEIKFGTESNRPRRTKKRTSKNR